VKGDDAGLRFWLRYVESAGGLWEGAGDTVLVVLPPPLQAEFQLADELLVTGDPDVAREDGATFIAAGHPVLGQAAETVLTGGDAGVVGLPAPASVPPDAQTLLASAREQFPVDHGRVDLAGAVTRGTRPVLRVGALANYTVSTEDHFQEKLEVWVDAVSWLQLPAPVSTRLARLAPEPVTGSCQLPDLRPAVAEAHRLIEADALRRQTVLSGQARDGYEQERDRIRVYYQEALASLQRRHAAAPADRQALYAARAESTRREQARRLAEIEEKYQARHEIRPYRLHVVQVPVLRLPVVVLRGSRPYPLVLDWQLPVSAFAELRCPACGEAAPLVAAKTKLGCERCLAGSPAAPAPVPTVAGPVPSPRCAPDPAPAGRGSVRLVPSAEPATPPAPVRPVAAVRTASQVRKAGEKLGYAWWEAAASGSRRLSRLVAPDSPAAALIRLYGAAGPAVAIGLGPNEQVRAVAAAGYPSERDEDDQLESTGGEVDTGRGRYSYQLRWRCPAGSPLVEEVLPFGVRVGARLPSPRYLFTPAASRLFLDLPKPRCDLDQVSALLWARALPRHGLPIVLRCLAAWWRVAGNVAGDRTPADIHPPAVLAASVERMVCLRAGSPGGRYDEAAAAYRADESAVRAASTTLQKRLQLSPSRSW
jgi:hypothetical protein